MAVKEWCVSVLKQLTFSLSLFSFVAKNKHPLPSLVTTQPAVGWCGGVGIAVTMATAGSLCQQGVYGLKPVLFGSHTAWGHLRSQLCPPSPRPSQAQRSLSWKSELPLPSRAPHPHPCPPGNIW